MSEEEITEAHELIMSMLEETLTAAQGSRLEEMVRQSADVRKLYLQMVHQRCVIATMGRRMALPPDLDVDQPPSERSLNDTIVVQAISNEDWAGDDEEILEAPPSAPRPPEDRDSGLVIWRWRKYLMAAAVGIVLCALGAILAQMNSHRVRLAEQIGPAARKAITQPAVVKIPASAEPIYAARLTGQIGAQWQGRQYRSGDGFTANAHLELAAGLAQVTYSTGTCVIFEGPADIVIEPNAVRLPLGKLSATVPPAGHGFAVRTQQSMIVDLGTELGVDAAGTGTEVDVFKGKVTAKPNSTGSPAVVLTAGNAAAVSSAKVVVSTQGAMDQKFVRQLHTDATSLDVVDLVAGGIGTTHRRGAGIDVRNGKYGNLGPLGTITGDWKYHPVILPVVDGCFVPNGLTRVDSVGDEFKFGPTSNKTYSGIHAGFPIAWPPGTAGDAQFTAVLGGIDYSKPGHGFLFIHASSGLTFNLAAIRRLYPDKQLADFHAIVGNTARWLRNNTTGRAKTPRTSAMVLVDGKARAQRMNFTYADGPQTISIPLSEGDRFLTLVMTDRQNDTEFDWTIFADPQIGLSGK